MNSVTQQKWLSCPDTLHMYRRQRMDKIIMYKILQGLDGIPFDDLFSHHHTVTRSSYNGYKLYKN